MEKGKKADEEKNKSKEEKFKEREWIITEDM